MGPMLHIYTRRGICVTHMCISTPTYTYTYSRIRAYAHTHMYIYTYEVYMFINLYMYVTHAFVCTYQRCRAQLLLNPSRKAVVKLDRTRGVLKVFGSPESIKEVETQLESLGASGSFDK